MKNIRNISMLIIAIILLQFVVIGIIVGTAKVQDVTLATDDVVECNEGWRITTEDGTTTEISSIPYYGKSKADEIIVAKKTVSDNMCGETLCFLSADKRLQIFVDDELIYSFGMDDKRVIGSTPGSVMVFADIPQDSEGKILQIKMQSPYEDYATYMTKMVVGDRDVAILYFLKNKILALICCLGILVCGIILLMFATVQRKSKQNSAKLFSIGMYFIILFVYHLIETKVPMIFYGNQVLYSNLILSEINAINSELVGLPLPALTVYPNISSITSSFPLLHATSIACLIARSTLLEVVLYFFAILGYNNLVI